MPCETEMIKLSLITAALVISSVGAFAQTPATPTSATAATPAASAAVKASVVTHEKATHVAPLHKQETKTTAAATTPGAPAVPAAPAIKTAEVKPAMAAATVTKEVKSPEAVKPVVDAKKADAPK